MRKLIGFFFLLTISCDYAAYHDLPTGPGAEQGQGTCTPGDTGAGPGITFEQVKSQVFQPRCFSCHGNGASSGGVNLSTFASARTWASQIKFAVINNTMPKSPNPPLAPAEKDLVIAWVDAGAPNTGAGGGNCDPDNPGNGEPTDPLDPIEEPLTEVPPDSEITYELVRNKIFKFRCFACHSTAGGNADGLNLETYFNTVDEIDDIYEEVSEGRMPLPPRPPLNQIERTTLLRWIDIGAPR